MKKNIRKWIIGVVLLIVTSLSYGNGGTTLIYQNFEYQPTPNNPQLPSGWQANSEIGFKLNTPTDYLYYYNTTNLIFSTFSNDTLHNIEIKSPETNMFPSIIFEFMGGVLGQVVGVFATEGINIIASETIGIYVYPLMFSLPVGSGLGSWSAVSLIGNLGHQNGSTKGGFIGAVIGTALGMYCFFKYNDSLVLVPLLGCPSLGAVIGYNWRRL